MNISAKEKAIEISDNIDTELINYITDGFLRSFLCKNLAKQNVQQIIDSSPSLPILSDNGTYGSDIEESTLWWKEVLKCLKEM